MNKDREAYYRSVEEDKKKKQRENRKKIKRFDDIFRMLFLVITIMISVGSNTFGNVNLWTTIGFIAFSLIFWMLGHAMGAYKFLDTEVSLKLYAWAFASFVAPIIFIKFALGLSTLGFGWVVVSFFSSLVLTVSPYYYLRSALDSRQRSKWTRNLLFLFLYVLYVAYLGYIVI
jgi:hypothetical protein